MEICRISSDDDNPKCPRCGKRKSDMLRSCHGQNGLGESARESKSRAVSVGGGILDAGDHEAGWRSGGDEVSERGLPDSEPSPGSGTVNEGDRSALGTWCGLDSSDGDSLLSNLPATTCSLVRSY